MFKYVFHGGSDVFVANVSKITTMYNKNVLDSEWTLISHTLRLVAASQQNLRICVAYKRNCRPSRTMKRGVWTFIVGARTVAPLRNQRGSSGL